MDTLVSKVDSTGTRTFLRDGAYVTDPVLNDGAANYTLGTSERRSGTSTWYHAGFKNAESQTAANQTVAATKTFGAFGNPNTSSGTWKGPFGYGGPFGYQSDPDSGLMLLGHRYYDSSTGRFLTRVKKKDERNWYAYTNGRPCSYADPEGQPAVLIVIAIAAVAVLAIDVADAPTGNEPPGPVAGTGGADVPRSGRWIVRPVRAPGLAVTGSSRTDGHEQPV